MKIAICEFGQETNSFAIGPYSIANLTPDRWVWGDSLISRFEGSRSYLGGMIQAAREDGDQPELIALPSIKIFAGPTLSREFVDTVLERICTALAPLAGTLDGICFALHGAGCAEGVDDLESHTLRALRSVVGDSMPITCSADLHSNLSHEMVALSQGIFGIKENPHVDCHAAGHRAMTQLIRLIRGESRPMSALVQLPLLITPATGSTYSYPMKDIKEYFAAYCSEHGLLDATFFHGFSAADHPNSMASVLVIADGYAPTEHARQLAQYVWAKRDAFIPVSLTPDQAIDLALERRKGGYVVINEISDNVGSGCPGDGTHLLRALLSRNLPRTIFQNIYDPEVAAQAHEAGVGAKISIRLGAKTDHMHGQPLELSDVEVLALSDRAIPRTSPMDFGLPMNLGKVARLKLGNVEFTVISVRTQTLDDSALTMTGVTTADYDIICLKSANHFRGYFEPRADAIVTAEPPGLRSSNLHSYPFRRISRPIFPLDQEANFS